MRLETTLPGALRAWWLVIGVMMVMAVALAVAAACTDTLPTESPKLLAVMQGHHTVRPEIPACSWSENTT